MSRPKLLLADDSITIQKVVNLTFADHGIDVVTFADGDSAIENFDQEKPDIVLADVNMPGINGYQLCELLRSDAASSNIPIVLLVGSFEPFDREEAERVGASAHLTKPFSSIAELISTVEGLLAAPEAQAENGSAPEYGPTAEQTDPPPPDTTDIDNLYEQSFVETVEIPQDAAAGYEFEPVDLDDEMIQTSYVGGDSENDLAPEIPESLSVGEGEDFGKHEPATEQYQDTDPLIDESVPMPERVEEADAAPEEQRVSDPFASPAADLPAVSSDETRPWENSDTFSFDDSDLLELPSPSPANPIPQAAGVSAKPGEITSLAPELIDLIVDKVVERLAQRAKAGESHSNTHS